MIKFSSLVCDQSSQGGISTPEIGLLAVSSDTTSIEALLPSSVCLHGNIGCKDVAALYAQHGGK